VYLARVVGRVVATVKQETLSGQPLQWLQPVDAGGADRGGAIVAVDPIGLGPGELCYYITAREASLTLWDTFAAVDAGIVGKVDRIDLEDRGQGSGAGVQGRKEKRQR
jgi:ethanolamine utilization protein EutN